MTSNIQMDQGLDQWRLACMHASARTGSRRCNAVALCKRGRAFIRTSSYRHQEFVPFPEPLLLNGKARVLACCLSNGRPRAAECRCGVAMLRYGRSRYTWSAALRPRDSERCRNMLVSAPERDRRFEGVLSLSRLRCCHATCTIDCMTLTKAGLPGSFAALRHQRPAELCRAGLPGPCRQ